MAPSSLGVAIVVPCYNEAARLRIAALSELARVAGCDVVAVDDGSTDATAALLAEAAAADARVHVVQRPRNRGKGEAVRQGLLWSLAAGYDVVGFCDADFATPATEVARLIDACHQGHVVALGSRVGLLGHQIERSLPRHYTGRVFGTLSSVVLGFQVYDTQCGAKVFRGGPALQAALDDPFASRWAFDVELLGRLAHQHRGTADFLEVPLQQWHDVAGSKLSLAASLRATADLARIRRALARHRRVTPAA
ncbi:MAG: glycosyltransferase [Acidimicrobiaceae bacterium]|jgi:dolichyl-phosphate beta-glucosyltransferase|nr:glycosyltransferase [Acidimicrobiaceae bacterium]MBP6488815.1 glycosyltransferase [Ilumatobacteraceae bacterium]MBP7889428.1 glycosyltransferase [Ilumatobacteraceae bacterium]